MRSSKQSTATPPFDLTVYTEATRRALYDAVVAVHFSPPADRDPAPEEWFPPYSPDQAGLVVYHEHSRWFAVWTMLEEADSDLPPNRKVEMIRITSPGGGPFGLDFHEV
jgi:hypothetical protein